MDITATEIRTFLHKVYLLNILILLKTMRRGFDCLIVKSYLIPDPDMIKQSNPRPSAHRFQIQILRGLDWQRPLNSEATRIPLVSSSLHLVNLICCSSMDDTYTEIKLVTSSIIGIIRHQMHHIGTIAAYRRWCKIYCQPEVDAFHRYRWKRWLCG